MGLVIWGVVEFPMRLVVGWMRSNGYPAAFEQACGVARAWEGCHRGKGSLLWMTSESHSLMYLAASKWCARAATRSLQPSETSVPPSAAPGNTQSI
jgi:hypothetical protein